MHHSDDPTDDSNRAESGWTPNRRGLIKAATVAAAVTAIGVGGESASPSVQAASSIVDQRWSEATDGAVTAASAEGYRTVKANFRFYAIGSSWAGSDGAWPVVEYSFSDDGANWSSSILSPAAVEDVGRPNRDGRIFSQLVFLGGANYTRYRILDASGTPARATNFQLFFIDATGGPFFSGISVSAASQLPPLQKPAIISRANWGCPDPNGKTDAYGLIWPPEYQTVEHIIIHHSETENDTDGGNAVRSIYDYHTNDRGWGDIGYNYLVDKNGNIYEGRYGGTNVVGGHAFQYAFGSSGMCAVGSFMYQDVTSACKNAMINITAWVGRNLDPLGKSDFHQVRSLPTISGHRDTNETECPGDVFYTDLPYIRTKVANLLGTTSHTPAPTVGAGPKFMSGDNVIFLADTRLYTDPSSSAHLVKTAKKNSYGAIDGAPKVENGKTWQEVRVSPTIEGYCLVSQIDFAPAGNPPAAIFELGDTVIALSDMPLRRSAGEAQNAPYSLSAGDSLYVSGASVAATGSRWISVMSQSHATGYVKQQDVALARSRAISISSSSGPVGKTITLSVNGFPATRTTAVTWSGAKIKTFTTTSSGSGSVTFAASESTGGGHTVAATVGVASASTRFSITPSASISPASGKTYANATVTLWGFGNGGSIAVQWLQGSTWKTLTTVNASAIGSASATIQIPAAASGTISIRGSGNGTATTSFTVTGAGATPTPTNTPTKTSTPTATSTPANTSTPTATSTGTPTSTATTTPTSTATATPTSTSTATATSTSTSTPTSTATSTSTATPTNTPTDTPTATSTPV